jgi:hypothetical protein
VLEANVYFIVFFFSAEDEGGGGGGSSRNSGNGRRRRRSVSQERFVEILVVADGKMVSYHGDNLVHYILTLMSVVSPISFAYFRLFKKMLRRSIKKSRQTKGNRRREAERLLSALFLRIFFKKKKKKQQQHIFVLDLLK